MLRLARPRVAAGAALAASALFGAVACVDLFHSTDFATLCALDADACATEAGADADAPTDAGPDGTSPVDFCALTSDETHALAERACGYLGACLGTSADSTFGACMIRALAAYDCAFNPTLRPRGATATLWQCLSTVSSCDDLALCVFGTRAPSCRADPSATTAYTACNLADGSVVVECGSEALPLGMSACATRGQTCGRIDSSNARCMGARGAACTGEARCEGTAAVVCRSAGGIDADEGVDCAAYGDGRCAIDDAGLVACAPSADAGACTEGDGGAAVTCSEDGAFAESCVDGRAVRIHCNAIGLKCNAAGVPANDPVTACETSISAGACSTADDACEGGTLRSCVRGEVFRLACADVPGLAACAQPDGRSATCTVATQ